MPGRSSVVELVIQAQGVMGLIPGTGTYVWTPSHGVCVLTKPRLSFNKIQMPLV